MLRRMPLRLQVVFCIAAVQLVALAVGGAWLVKNARDAVEIEVGEGQRSARALVLATLGSALQDTPPSEILPWLADVLVEPRHVDLALIDAHQGLLPVRKVSDVDAPKAAPDWFRRLVTPGLRETRIPVQVNGGVYGYVLMTTAPTDEIAEVWQDVVSLLWIVAGTALASMVALSVMVRRALSPLYDLHTAMTRLQKGDLSTRATSTDSADLAPIFAGFDALSESLERAEADRAVLNHRIIELGDAERRSIAMELHDEFGPCLFGLKVKASAIARTVREAGNDRLAADADAILDIVAQIQASNARLLSTLRPMAIGQLPLVDALHDLFGAFGKTHPQINWTVDLPARLPETPEILDLTIYRAFQEGATNALRHGLPQAISARLLHIDGQTGPRLRLEIEDDGLGMPEQRSEGRGLRAMRDRISAIGGRLVIAQTSTGGTSLSATLPLDFGAGPSRPNMETAS